MVTMHKPLSFNVPDRKMLVVNFLQWNNAIMLNLEWLLSALVLFRRIVCELLVYCISSQIMFTLIIY